MQARVTAMQAKVMYLLSNLGVKIEKCLQAGPKLLFDFFLAAFKYMHSHVSLSSIGQFHGSLPDLDDVLRGQQPHAVYKG